MEIERYMQRKKRLEHQLNMQTALGDYGTTKEQKTETLKNIMEQVKDVYDKYPDTVHSDILLAAIWLKEWCNREIDPKTMAFMQQYKLKITTLSRSGRKLRSLSKRGVIDGKYERDQDYSKLMEDAYIGAFCND